MKKTLFNDKEEELLFGIDKLNIPRSSVPAITHVDYSARIQTVQNTNPFIMLSLNLKKKQIAQLLLILHLTLEASQ